MDLLYTTRGLAVVLNFILLLVSTEERKILKYGLVEIILLLIPVANTFW